MIGYINTSGGGTVIFDESPSPGTATYIKDGVIDFGIFRHYELTIEGLNSSASNTFSLVARLGGADVAATGHNGALVNADATPQVTAAISGFGSAGLILSSYRAANTTNLLTLDWKYNSALTFSALSWVVQHSNGANARESTWGQGTIGVTAVDGFKLSMLTGNITSISRLMLVAYR